MVSVVPSPSFAPLNCSRNMDNVPILLILVTFEALYHKYLRDDPASGFIAEIVKTAFSPASTVVLTGCSVIIVSFNLISANAFIGKSENTITSASARLNSLFFMIFLLRCVLKLIHSNYIFFTC